MASSGVITLYQQKPSGSIQTYILFQFQNTRGMKPPMVVWAPTPKHEGSFHGFGCFSGAFVSCVRSIPPIRKVPFFEAPNS